ncbi:MAG: hypothetical protein F9K41_18985, partial [Sphingopyxis terrae]
MKPILAILPLMAAIPLSACAAAQGGDYPSLAKRPVEGRFDVAPPSVVVPPPGQIGRKRPRRLARWESDAAGAQQAFARERTPTEAAVTAAGGALADIDRLYLERSIAESVDGLPEIYALRDKLAAMLAAQDDVL